MIKPNWKHRKTSRSTGLTIEKKAEKWLLKQGLTFVERNYYCQSGEIDLIMYDAQTLVFVEVRFRSQSSFGDGVESVDWRKQKKLNKAAMHYLMNRQQHANDNCRFDVLAVKPSDTGNELRWRWIKNAF